VSARTKARKRALDILFEADQKSANLAGILRARQVESGRQTALAEYTVEIVQGVVDHWIEVNSHIAQAAQEWTMDRMPAVDRAVLRIATWEILYNPEITSAVAIDEALALAHDLSTDDSPKFINGVLGRIAREAEPLG
jgi:N utilization substance protein B